MNRLELLSKAHAVRNAADELIKAIVNQPLTVVARPEPSAPKVFPLPDDFFKTVSPEPRLKDAASQITTSSGVVQSAVPFDAVAFVAEHRGEIEEVTEAAREPVATASLPQLLAAGGTVSLTVRAPREHEFNLDQDVRLADSGMEGVVTDFLGPAFLKVRFSNGSYFAPLECEVHWRDLEPLERLTYQERAA